ncbi:uncharacterized protein LOC117342176 [Pecten maximus]|uniref:uncharacterized protein LOC117342176 n=1 Tax=Pecten maximus TaxID=6579 RepID=UPI001457EED0|nr:uncharacterized protein LOC117342176 [Pecten maximus]
MFTPWIRIALFITAVLGGLFFTVGIFAPGWEITHQGMTLKGIWFILACGKKTSSCEYLTYLEKYNQDKSSSHFSWVNEYEYSTAVGNQVLAIISLLSLYLGLFLALVVTGVQRLANIAGFIAAPCFLTSAALIWTHIGQESAAISAKNRIHSLEVSPEHQLTPYSMVLCGFGSIMTVGVALAYLIASVRYLMRIPIEKYQQF